VTTSNARKRLPSQERARAKLVDRSGSMVIIEIDKYRSGAIECSEVKVRIAAKDS
jgi:hypothetical protein